MDARTRAAARLRVSRPQHGTDPAVAAHLDERSGSGRTGIEPEVQFPEHVSGSGIADTGIPGGRDDEDVAPCPG